jgi:hypothetical protein
LPEGLREEVVLYPTGRIEGRLTSAEKHLLEEVTVGWRSAPGVASPVPPGEVQCPVEVERFSCEIPAGAVDLKLRAAGHIAHFRWGVEVVRGQSRALGALVLQRGASVLGWVTTAVEGVPLHEIQARLVPQELGRALREGEHRRGETLAQDIAVTERGFFHGAGVSPGRYALVLTHPRLAEERIGPFEVYEDRETEIREIELVAPLRFEVLVVPPGDPFRAPWTLALARPGLAAGYLDTVAAGPPSAEGRFVAVGLAAGPHQLSITDSRGSIWHNEDVEITAENLLHEVTLPYDRLEGRVTMAGEPVTARLYFGGRDHHPQIRIESDREGKFCVFLPRREAWFADVERLDPPLFTRVEGIRVERQPDEPWARVEIELPDTSVTGRVVDPEGRPVPGALVTVINEAPWREKGRSALPFGFRVEESDGSFLLSGRPPGEWSLKAQIRRGDGLHSADAVTVSVREGEPAGPITLVLRPRQTVQGLVVDPGGRGVPGAWVAASPDRRGPGTAPWTAEEAFTDVDGAFRLEIPPGTEIVNLTAFAPGFVVTQTRTPGRRQLLLCSGDN